MPIIPFCFAHHWPELSHIVTPSCQAEVGNVVFHIATLNKIQVPFLRKKRGRNTGWQMGVSVIFLDAYVQKTLSIIRDQLDHFADVINVAVFKSF